MVRATIAIMNVMPVYGKHMLVNALKRIDNPAGNKSSTWIKAFQGIYEAIKDKDEDLCFKHLHHMISSSDH